MKAMIMAAGVGSRLMPLTMYIPKPMIPMANNPLMENIVQLLSYHGIREQIANLHYHAQVISEHFGDGSDFGVSLSYSPEEELLGTAGGVKKCEWFLNDSFVIVSGDAMTDIDLKALITAHKKNGALATIALKEVDEVEHFGVVITDEEGKIESFQEKPRPQEALSHLANTGIYVFEPEIFKYIPPRQFYDFGKQVFPYLVKIGAPFYGVPTEDYWCDVGNIITYRQAHADILRGKVKLYPPERAVGFEDGVVLMGEDVHIGENVTFSGTVVLGNGAVIESDAMLQDTIVWDGSRIGRGAVLAEAIIGSSCILGSGVQVQSGSVVASGCVLDNGVIIDANSRIFNSATGSLNLEQG